MPLPATTRITAPYGRSDEYVGFHNGIDFAHVDPADTPVYAFRSGTVKSIGWVSGWAGLGLVVKVDHGGGLESWSCHLSGATVTVGQKVSAGQRIATMGNSATKYVHLHWVIVLNGVMVDPTPYLSSSAGGDITPFDPEEDDTMAKVYEDRGNAAPFPNTGKFYIGAPGAWLTVDNRDFGGDRFVRDLLTAKFGPIEGATTNELVGIRKTWLALAPASSASPPIDYAALAKALAKEIAVPTAEENAAAARAAIVK